MAYLERSADRRADVRRVLPSARTVIVTATVYNTARPYSTESADRGRAQIARYAWGDDYHDVIGARQDALLEWMRETADGPFEARAYVDTGPVQERVYARHAGIGWIGKNTCVINEELGSWVFLGAIITSLALDLDAPALDQCGTCTLCLEACPTQALVAPGVLDSTRCISYLTIEHRGALPEPLESGDRIARLRLRYLPGSVSLQRRRADDGRSGVAAAAGVGSAIDRGARADAGRRHADGVAGQPDAADQARRAAAQYRRRPTQRRPALLTAAAIAAWSRPLNSIAWHRSQRAKMR